LRDGSIKLLLPPSAQFTNPAWPYGSVEVAGFQDETGHLDWPTFAQIMLNDGSMELKVRCEAFARSTGYSCQAQAMRNGRCRNHGGLSTGPKTSEGRSAIAAATRQRMASGQRKQALDGFIAWLEGGGRVVLSNLAKSRERRRRWQRLMSL